jgi:hypothetical protein
MTAAPLAASELDPLDQFGAKAVDGFLGRRWMVERAGSGWFLDRSV